jgi:rare lipoprotein A
MTWRILVTLVAAGLAFACGLPSGDASANDPQGFSGLASHYTKGYEGKTTSGEAYDPKKFTAAHRTLPFGTRLRITDPKSHRSVDVTVNDRGPFTKAYVVDLSYAAAQVLHMPGDGLLKVTAAVQ